MTRHMTVLVVALMALGAGAIAPHPAQSQSQSQPQSRGRAPWNIQASESSNLPTMFSAPLAPQPSPEAYQAAPMPNSDANAPLQPPSKTAEVSPGLFQPRKQFRGDGFSYGSTAQGWQEQRLKPAPGIQVKVPLE